MGIDTEETLEDSTGLALSGGGFRATLFHIGSLWRLNEFGLLRKLKRISSVSGGSITSAVLALNWAKLDFKARDVATNFEEWVVQPLRTFCSRDIDKRAIAGALWPGQSAWNRLREAYDEFLFKGATLRDLPDSPRFIFNSANLRTGRNFRFTREYMGDYRIGLINTADVTTPGNLLSMAVAASSGFPPIFSPVEFTTDPSKWQKVEGADLACDAEYCKTLTLADGGVYDNLGLEPIWKRCRKVLISNAGKPFEYNADMGSLFVVADIRLMLRVLDVTMDQVQGLRLRDLVDRYQRKEREGAYWGLNTDIGRYVPTGGPLVPPTLPVSPQARDALASMRTRLNQFKPEEQERLINWGYAVCDAAMRCYGGCPAEPAAKWPYPARALS
jgi:NTE family protein